MLYKNLLNNHQMMVWVKHLNRAAFPDCSLKGKEIFNRKLGILSFGGIAICTIKVTQDVLEGTEHGGVTNLMDGGQGRRLPRAGF